MQLAEWVEGERRAKPIWLAIALVLLGYMCVAHASQQMALPSTVMCVKGRTVQYLVDSGKWRKLKAGTRINPGTLIRTGEDSCVDLLLGQPEPIKPAFGQNAALYVFIPSQTRNILRVLGNSTVRLERVDGRRIASWSNSVEAVTLMLQSGELSADFPVLDAGGLHELRIPSGKVLVKQAIFKLKLSGDLEVFSGAATLDQDGKKREVQAAQHFNPVNGSLSVIDASEMHSHSPTMYRFSSDSSGPVPLRKF